MQNALFNPITDSFDAVPFWWQSFSPQESTWYVISQSQTRRQCEGIIVAEGLEQTTFTAFVFSLGCKSSISERSTLCVCYKTNTESVFVTRQSLVPNLQNFTTFPGVGIWNWNIFIHIPITWFITMSKLQGQHKIGSIRNPAWEVNIKCAGVLTVFGTNLRIRIGWTSVILSLWTQWTSRN